MTIAIKSDHLRQEIFLDEESAESVNHQLRAYLKSLNAKLWKCPECGALTPEIMLSMNGQNYRLICTKIENEKGVIAETDFRTFLAYLKNRI